MSNGYVNPWWQAMLLPDKWDICGIEVFTLSVWHLYTLENLNNPYIVEGIQDRDAAANLLLICQRDYSGGRELYLSHRVRLKALAKIHKSILPLKFAELDNACTDYIRACTRTPEHKRPVSGSGGKLMSAPPQWHIVSFLCRKYHKTETEAWNTPYVRAQCAHDVWRESIGDETLVNPSLQRRNDESEEKKILGMEKK